MILNSYYICDKDGYILSKVLARTLLNELQSDNTKRWTLKNLHGQSEHYVESESEMICHEDCWVNPDADFSDKVKKGCEKEFEFFMEHGYHMPRKVKNADD
jgi:hypothetical protein